MTANTLQWNELPSERQGEILWTAGLAAMRAGRPGEATTAFALAARTAGEPYLRGLCLLGRAAAMLAVGDQAAARATYEAVLATPDLGAVRGRARAGLAATTGVAAPPGTVRLTRPRTASGGRPIRFTLAATGSDWLLAPWIELDPVGGGERVRLSGCCGRFAGDVVVPPGGLAYRLVVPGWMSRLDPGEPRIRVGAGDDVASLLPGGRRPPPAPTSAP